MLRPLAVKVSRVMGLDTQAHALLDIAVGVRDIGMVGLPDSVVLTTTPLSPADWELINRHPVIGEQLLRELFVVAAAAGIVRAHHERWDGAGYPDGISGEAIPLISRVIATCDAFTAIATDRPHRRGIGAEAALERVCQESGSQFDPRTVDALVAALAGEERSHTTRVSTATGSAARRRSVGGKASDRGGGLTRAIEEFDVIPALAPAYERVSTGTATGDITGGDLVAAIESDTGLTVAVLRQAQNVGRRRRIANVADAVAALGPTEIQIAIKDLPRTEFPWRSSELEVLMHRSRVHAQAVARAADRITREAKPGQRDDVLVAALLHDIGKLALGRAFPEYIGATEKTSTPEARIRVEQRAWGMDHAGLGALLLRRWNLPDALASTVATHHSSAAEEEVATYVRLADMVAHHAQGDSVDRHEMLRLAHICGLSTTALRTVLFDLPHSGGSQRRRAEPSPLSERQTAVLRILAQGKVYQEIARELGVAASTVRSHLQSIYAKLGVEDRAQAVLRATEMGWI
jgi:putative nucleotidyltransferase with HDIG domain